MKNIKLVCCGILEDNENKLMHGNVTLVNTNGMFKNCNVATCLPNGDVFPVYFKSHSVLLRENAKYKLLSIPRPVRPNELIVRKRIPVIKGGKAICRPKCNSVLISKPFQTVLVPKASSQFSNFVRI